MPRVPFKDYVACPILGALLHQLLRLPINIYARILGVRAAIGYNAREMFHLPYHYSLCSYELYTERTWNMHSMNTLLVHSAA